jgi:transposase
VQHLGHRPGAAAAGHHAEKKSLRAAEQDRPELRAAREAWRAEFGAIDPARLVFVDESGTTTAMTRRHGRAPRGRRVDGAVPHGHWKVMTLTAAVRLGGVGGCLVLDGAVDAMAFETYVERVLAPTLRPGDVVVMDNLSSHKRDEVAAAIGAVGAEVRYLPPYSPDLNPIEKMSSKLKEYLRSAAARTIEGLIEAIGAGLLAVTGRDILGWFRSCGYRQTQ